MYFNFQLLSSKLDLISIPFELRAVFLIFVWLLLYKMMFLKDDNGKYFVHYIRSPYLSDDEDSVILRRSKRIVEKNKK